MGRGRRSESGQVAVLTALGLVAILGAAALTVDVGHSYAVRDHMQSVAAAAAMAGAQSLPSSSAAEQMAEHYLALNQATGSASVSQDEVTAKVTGEVPFYFAEVLGFSGATINVSATATKTPVGEASGVRPFGVTADGFVEDQDYTLKSGSGCGGNFGALALGGNGASNYENNIVQGYPSELTVGEEVETEPGKIVGPTDAGVEQLIEQDPEATWETVQAGSPRLVVVPIITTPGNGKSTVTIEGFGLFFLESVSDGDVTGRFLNYVSRPGQSAPSGSQDFGYDQVTLVSESY